MIHWSMLLLLLFMLQKQQQQTTAVRVVPRSNNHNNNDLDNNHLICNHVGNEMFLDNLPWSQRDDWVKATRYAWKARNIQHSPYTNSMASGYYKAYENLAFLKLMDSGHMVPMDVPDVALDMIRTFIYQHQFQQYEQEIGRSVTAPQCDACPGCPIPSNKDGSKNNSNSSNGKSNGPSSQTPESNELGQFVIAHAWMGAILGVVVFGMAILCKRQQHRRLDAPPQYSLELRTNPADIDSNHPNAKYRDRDPSNHSFDDEDDVEYSGDEDDFQYEQQHPSNGHNNNNGRGGRALPPLATAVPASSSQTHVV